jgi:alpha-N-acetylglucosamine transferase
MNKKRILLVTKTVHEVPGACLLHMFWELRESDHMEVASERLSRCEKRFRGTFTKLEALDQDLLEFDKIALLDINTVVLKNCDELFAYPTPSATFRGNPSAVPGSMKDSITLFNKDDLPNGGINAGVVLLSPSKN